MVVFGLMFLSSLSSYLSMQRFGTTNYYFFHQILFGLLPALVLGTVAFKIPLSFVKKVAPIVVLSNIIALASVFIPGLGMKFWGATRWLNIGGFVLQPSEFLKITSILYLSAWIASKLSEDNVKGWKSEAKKSYHNVIYVLVPFLIFLGAISIIMIFQKDLTTLGIIGLTLITMYFYGKTPLWHTFFILSLSAIGLTFFIKYESYRLDRWLIFLNPDADPMGKGFQLTRSLTTIGSGGIFGKGLGMSVQKLGGLPQATSDFIFAILGEETGIVGCVILIILFLLFFWFGMKIAQKSNDRFSRLTAMGITFWIVLQAFVNIGSVIGLLPVSGVPLPFLSAGGSHMVTELIGVGLLLNISKNT